MIRSLLLAVAAQLLTAAAVSADGVPHVPRGMKYIQPHVRFADLDQYPDYVFFVWNRFLHHPAEDAKDGPPYQIKDASALRLSWGNRDRHILLAMKRLDFERRAQYAPKLDWLTDKTEGVQSVGLRAPSHLAPVTMAEVPVATYHITFRDGRLAVDLEDDARVTGGLLPPWAFGLLASVAIAWLGLWFVRRRSAAPQPRELT